MQWEATIGRRPMPAARTGQSDWIRVLNRQPGSRHDVGIDSLAATRALGQRTAELDLGACLTPIERKCQRDEFVSTARRAKDQGASWWHPAAPFVRTLGDGRSDPVAGLSRVWTESLDS
jgi:hypothetical protein